MMDIISRHFLYLCVDYCYGFWTVKKGVLRFSIQEEGFVVLYYGVYDIVFRCAYKQVQNDV